MESDIIVHPAHSSISAPAAQQPDSRSSSGSRDGIGPRGWLFPLRRRSPRRSNGAVPLSRHTPASARLPARVKLLAVCAAFISAIVLSAHGYAAWRLLRPPIAPLSSNPLQAVGLAYDTVSFRTDSSILEGWYIAAPRSGSDTTVVLSHGYGGNREELWVPFYTLAEALHQRSYNVLMFDYGYVNRALNPRRVVSGGVYEAAELNAAVAYARGAGASRVIVWGFSLGAGTALQAALRTDNPPDAMILDSAFLPDESALASQLRSRLPYAPDWSAKLIARLLPVVGGPHTADLPSADVGSAAYPMPLLLVHGLKDTLAPYTLSESIYANQLHQPLSELWLPEKRGHEMTLRFQPDEYLQRAFRFIEQITLP